MEHDGSRPMKLVLSANRVPELTGDAKADVERLRQFIVDSFRSAGQGASFAKVKTAGVQFPSTQVPSSNVNTLDDYEEGSFTPTFTFGTPGDLAVTYTRREGVYTKVGDLVLVEYQIFTSAFTHTTAAGNATITGLPFTSNATTGQVSYGGGEFGGVNKAGYTQVTPRILANSANIVFNASGMGVAPAAVTAADMPTGGTVSFRGSIFYKV